MAALYWVNSSPKPRYMYHYIRWHWMREYIERGKISLSDPKVWKDPTERLWTNWVKENARRSVLCMCWTRTCRSELQWRLERSADEGEPKDKKWTSADKVVVRIRTTFDRLEREVSKSSDLQSCLIGDSYLIPVKYLRDSAVVRRYDGLANMKNSAQAIASVLSLKRYPYRYEREVRLVHVTAKKLNLLDRTPIAVNVNNLIDQIMIEPNAARTDIDTIRSCAISAGFTNSVLHSRLYSLPERLENYAL